MAHQENFRFGQTITLGVLPYVLRFVHPARTSRDTMYTREVWYITAKYENHNSITGIGECAPIPGLSLENNDQLAEIIQSLCKTHHPGTLDVDKLAAFPSLKFAIETALIDLSKGGKQLLFESDFTRGNSGIPINGLVWMSTKAEMIHQAENKIANGFTCIKMKVGAIEMDEELDVIRHIRKNHPGIEIRVDANGGLSRWKDDQKSKLDLSFAISFMEALAELKVHSIEQPIFGSPEEYAELCSKKILPVALDEQLIPIISKDERKELLQTICPEFIILKPSLLGGLSECEEWIAIAEEKNIKWWITSALESNLGLNAIAQWTATQKLSMPQGLGTGSLFENNIPSPLKIENGELCYDRVTSFDLGIIFDK